MPYKSPLSDIRFILDHVVPLAPVTATDRFAEATPDMVEAVLTEAAKLCDTVIAPLNRAGDQHGAALGADGVQATPGFDGAYRQIAQGGWVSVSADPDYGGMGLPQSLAVAINDMMSGACLALQLKPLLSQGQIEALEHHADNALKALYLPKLVSGEWSGTMNLTEPQAGSDVGALRSRAEPLADGTFAVSGQKIFISWGDSDLVSNVCHLVLARLPDAPAGIKGISLFMVPKFLPDAKGEPGARNGVTVVSLEHKLGLHGSPTCVMEFDGATGWMVGEPNKGMAAMFTMMNNARLAVGVQGIGVAEAACQQALAYAQDRVQFAPIVQHPDVKRMLTQMRAEIFAARSIALACSVALDLARATGSGDWQARAALLTPIAKSYGTDVGCRVADLGIQVHGGMGFIEETGAAQFFRDVRVTAIYEGTNGIQAMDLVGRKMMDQGRAALTLLQEIEDEATAARDQLPDLAEAVWQAAESLREATEWLVAQSMEDRFAGAAPYLQAFAHVLGAHYHLRAGLADPGRVALARAFVLRILPRHLADIAELRAGGAGLSALSVEDLGT
ncbi:acyl-CoA dehydrogenase [Thioclava sp. SK-1]|uniref:acyl-CoA dehydrogenase n=1 Tax=Thioclava sp. SK-1 TaxID=1889770 RepID=UPI00082569A8|nr:acyl-CoA dehydrogenase [Thioclava sp. SK-1]OCX66892.1 acyl-CoA dehydrogenase [Thioclava sp. SK-1]